MKDGISIPPTITEKPAKRIVGTSVNIEALSVYIGDDNAAYYSICLLSKPLAPVEVTIVNRGPHLSVFPYIINFTPSEYSTPKWIRIMAKDDKSLQLSRTIIVVRCVLFFYYF